MLGSRVHRTQLPVAGSVPDALVVVHGLLCFNRADHGVTVEVHIRPKRRTKESKSIKLERVVFEDMNICSFGLVL